MPVGQASSLTRVHAGVQRSSGARFRMSSINYGGLLFTNPVPVAYALPPQDPGLYVIQVRNLSFGPMPFQPIAFGASDNLAAIRLELHPHFPRRDEKR